MARKPDPEKRSQILRAATRVFAEREFHLVPVDDVASAAGVGKGTLYLYFPTKEQLFYATILETLDALLREVDAATRGERGPEALRAFIQSALAFFWHRRPLVVLMHRYEHKQQEPAGAEWRARRARLAAVVRGILQPEVRAGHLRSADLGLAVEMLFALMRAAILNHEERDRAEHAADFVAGLFLHGLRRPETTRVRRPLRTARVARAHG